MKTRKHTILPLAALAGLALATSANATVLTFEGLGTNASIPDTFGDNIAAAETGISVSNGTTENIDLTWSTTGADWQFYNDGEWQAAQLDAFNVGNTYDLQFTPDAGFGTLVDSFVFDDYASWQGGNKFNWSLFQDSAAGTVIASGTGETTDGQNLTVNTGMATAYAGTVLMRIEKHPDNVGGGNSGQALDTISFTQQAIPEPSSMALLGLGGLALILRRRK